MWNRGCEWAPEEESQGLGPVPCRHVLQLGWQWWLSVPGSGLHSVLCRDPRDDLPLLRTFTLCRGGESPGFLGGSGTWPSCMVHRRARGSLPCYDLVAGVEEGLLHLRLCSSCQLPGSFLPLGGRHLEDGGAGAQCLVPQVAPSISGAHTESGRPVMGAARGLGQARSLQGGACGSQVSEEELRVPARLGTVQAWG